MQGTVEVSHPAEEVMRQVIVLLFVAVFGLHQLEDSVASLSRQRRYLTFPEGSTFSFAFCLQFKALTAGDVDVFTEAAAAALNYDLPNNTRALGLFTDSDHSPTPVLGRSDRNHLYSKLEALMEAMGIDGKQCVLRAVCEAAQELGPQGTGLFAELLRVILSYPDGGYTHEEPDHQWTYLAAYKAGVRNLNCHDLYWKCPVSFLRLVLGLKPLPHSFN